MRRSGERWKERSVTEEKKTRWEKAKKSEVETKSGNKREERRDYGAENEKDKERTRGTSTRCGGRQVSRRAHFALAFANGDILQKEDEEETEREREKKKRKGVKREKQRRRVIFSG